jgi:hypothetical protein
MTLRYLSAPSSSGGAARQNTTARTDANSDYYMSLRPPYLARNGPFQTVRELLMVRGVTSELLLGNDRNQNGFLDGGEDPSDQGPPGSKPPPPPHSGLGRPAHCHGHGQECERVRQGPRQRADGRRNRAGGGGRASPNRLPGRLSPTGARISCKAWTIF